MKKRALILCASMLLTLSTSAMAQGVGATGTRARGGVGPLAASSAGSASRSCEEAGPTTNLGIGTFHCQGGNCRVRSLYSYNDGANRSGTPEGSGDPTDWEFTVEPSLWEIHPNGPAAGRVQEGDYLVAVNGVPVTTRVGANVLGRMLPGRPVTLTVRRGGNLVDAQIFPSARCASDFRFTVSSGSDEMPRFLARDTQGRITRLETLLTTARARSGTAGAAAGRSGIESPSDGASTLNLARVGVTLTGVAQQRVGGSGVAASLPTFTEEPRITATEGGFAASAGLATGDLLVSVNGIPVRDPASLQALAAATQRPVTVVVRRNGAVQSIVIRP